MLSGASPTINGVLSVALLVSFGTMVALERSSPVVTELVRQLAGRRGIPKLEHEDHGSDDAIEAATEFVQQMEDLLSRFDEEEAADEVATSTAEAEPVAEEIEVDLTERDQEPEPVLQSPRRILSDAEVFAATRGTGFRAHPWSDQAYPSP